MQMCSGRPSATLLAPFFGFEDYNLNQNEAQSARAESTHKGVNQRWKDVTQTQQQRPESPTVTSTWHAIKYKVHKLHQRYIFIVFVLCDER